VYGHDSALTVGLCCDKFEFIGGVIAADTISAGIASPMSGN
jgi:hypothetical protein